ARPNFMKIAPIIRAIEKAKENGAKISFSLVHTGQHYDQNMSDQFFLDLNIPRPTVNLDAGGGSQAEQTAAIMVAFEKYLVNHPTDLVIVVGDVTSTLACSIVAKKCGIKVAHVEAGIRSGDWTMPEEINRIVTDSITDYFFTTSETANENLRKSGIPDEKIFYVGNTMIDTLLFNLHRLRKPKIWSTYNLSEKNYFVLTLHRPSNVDNPEKLEEILQEISKNSHDFPIVFPVHPRTRQNIIKHRINVSNIYMCDPLGYLEFMYLVKNAKAVITDSGGITEETTVLGIPCITLRNTTERPETVTIGTNELIGNDPQAIAPVLDKLFSGDWRKGSIPPLWDGKTADRIISKLIELYPWN
ncbi:MAG: UDP-N-acetylglucosamine 2-epimerase (non-hydrolyzing), partial [Candidatus Jordarchaeaceae archaeon]